VRVDTIPGMNADSPSFLVIFVFGVFVPTGGGRCSEGRGGERLISRCAGGVGQNEIDLIQAAQGQGDICDVVVSVTSTFGVAH
jgi:hypothetical protein